MRIAPLHTHTQTHTTQALEQQIAAAKRDVKAASSLVCGEELVHRTRVLRRLGYLTEDDIVTVKGRAAAELALGDELVLGDMLFSGLLQGLPAEQLAALLSCFVWRERREGGGKVGGGVVGGLVTTWQTMCVRVCVFSSRGWLLLYAHTMLWLVMYMQHTTFTALPFVPFTFFWHTTHTNA